MEWKDWCRLCASTDGKSLTVFDNLDQLLPEKIFKYLSITIHNQDEMPQTVCDACSRRVTVFDRFADQCLQVQNLFKALLQQKNEGIDDSDRIALLRDEFLTNSNGFRQIDSPPPLPCAPAARLKEEAEQMSIEVDPFLLGVATASAGAGAASRAGRGGSGRGRRARGRGRGRGGSRGRGRRVPSAAATASPAAAAGPASPAPARRGRGGPGRRASHRANSRLQAQLRHAEDDDDDEEDDEEELVSHNHVGKVKLEPTAESEDEEEDEEDDEDEDENDDEEKDAVEDTADSGVTGKVMRKRRGSAKKDKALVGAAKRKAQTPRVLKHKTASEGVLAGAGGAASPTTVCEERVTDKAMTEQPPADSCPVPASEGDSATDGVKDDPDPFGDTGFDDYDSPDDSDKPQPSEERADPGDQPSIFRWECHVCKEVFRNWNSLSVHCRQTHDVPAQVVCLCAKVLASRASIIKHRLKHTNAYKYKCDKCDKAFHRKSLFDLHMLSHVPKEEQPYVCCKCARRFHCEALLRHHERVHLPREERLVYPCSVCAKKFSSRSNVSAHLKAVHFGERPFVCDQCGHSFTSKGILQEHLTIHSDETPFKCTQCKKSFKTKYRLKIHMDTHRETPYQCPICPHQLSTRRTLRMHLLVHRDVKAYQCATCGKAFKRSKDLKNHHNLHTGVRPYTCTFCPRTFANGSNCRAHKRKMHPEELRAYEAQLAAAAEAGEAPPPPPPRAIAPPPPGSGQQQHQPTSATLQATPTAPPAPAASPSQSTGPPPAPAHAAIDIVQPSSDLKPPTDLKSPSAVLGVPPCTEYDRHIMYEGSGGSSGGDNGLKTAVTHASRPQEYAPTATQMSRTLPPHLSDLARLGENGLCRGSAASELEAAVGARAMAMNLNARRGGGDLLNSHLGSLAPLNLNVSEMQHANRQHQQQHQHPAMSDGGGGGGLTELEDGSGYLGTQRRGEAYGGGRAHMGLAAVGLGTLSGGGLGTGLPMHRQQQIQQQQQQQQGMALNHRPGATGMHPTPQHSAPDPQAYHLYQHHSDAMPSAMAAAIAHSASGMSVPAFPGNPYIHHNMGYSRGGNVM